MGGGVCGRAELFINAPPECVYHLLGSMDRIKEWMPSCNMHKVADVDSSGLSGRDSAVTLLEIAYCTFQLYSPVAMRDWCILRFASAQADGSFVLGCESVSHPACPEVPGFIRGQAFPTGFVLKPASSTNSHSTVMTLIFQFDVKGWLPSVLRTLFQSEYLIVQTTNVFMNGIRRAIEDKQRLLSSAPSLVDSATITSEDSFFEILKASNTEDSLGWHSVVNQDFEVHAKIDGTLSITKAIFKVHSSPEEIFELLIDETRFKEFLPNLREIAVLERTIGSVSNPVKCLGNLTFDSSFDKVLKLTVSSDLGCEVDFCLLQSSLFNSEDGMCVVLFRSVSHSGLWVDDAQMGKILPSGFIIAPLPHSGSLVSTALQADLERNFPPLMRALPSDQVCSLLSGGFVSIIHRLESVLASKPPRPQTAPGHGLETPAAFQDPLCDSPLSLPYKRTHSDAQFTQTPYPPHKTMKTSNPDDFYLSPQHQLSATPSLLQQPPVQHLQPQHTIQHLQSQHQSQQPPVPPTAKRSHPVPMMFNPNTNQITSPAAAVGLACDSIMSMNHSGMMSMYSTPQGPFRKTDRGRLIWTDDLHECFVRAVRQLGVDTARPQAILQLMGVDGLTPEHVKSHLQKYRGQLKAERERSCGDKGGGLRKMRKKTSSNNSLNTMATDLSEPSILNSTAPSKDSPCDEPAGSYERTGSDVSEVIKISESLAAKAQDFQLCLGQFCSAMSALSRSLTKLRDDERLEGSQPE
eukprot:c45531_g1_i1.p1 GENE.c45531_g1_i1~~c45531_g1_i1.p1  ORF type:complete len:809 (-),score=151.67 c45531_g1_i1:80-2320(-)